MFFIKRSIDFNFKSNIKSYLNLLFNDNTPILNLDFEFKVKYLVQKLLVTDKLITISYSLERNLLFKSELGTPKKLKSFKLI